MHLSRDLMFSKAFLGMKQAISPFQGEVLIDMCELSMLLFMVKCNFKLDMFKKNAKLRDVCIKRANMVIMNPVWII